jgi:hypothetical protein
MGRLTCDCARKDIYQISIYPTPTEIYGGAHDGALAPLSVDLVALAACFTEVTTFGWEAIVLDNSGNPCIHIQGKYQGRAVNLRLASLHREGAQPGQSLEAV